MKKVLITRSITQEAKAYLEEHVQCVTWEGKGEEGQKRLIEMIADVDGLYTSNTLINSELLNHARKLKVVSNASAGYNNFDIEAMRNAGIIGTNTPGVLDDTVADLIMSLMLATSRRIPELDQLIRQGQWRKGMDKELYGIDVHHTTLGIIGMGGIGQAVAKRAHHGFDMNILYYNRSRNEAAEEQYDAQYCSLETLLAQSDFVVIMTPLTEETVKMIGKEQFALMKKSGIFINASRGQTVDENALIEALRSGTIRAAGLDVFEIEPLPVDSPLLTMSNVVLAPHIGSATLKTRDDMGMLAAQNLVAGLAGQTPPNLIREFR